MTFSFVASVFFFTFLFDFQGSLNLVWTNIRINIHTESMDIQSQVFVIIILHLLISYCILWPMSSFAIYKYFFFLIYIILCVHVFIGPMGRGAWGEGQMLKGGVTVKR